MLIENFEYLSPGARRRRERRAHEQDSPGSRNRLIRIVLETDSLTMIALKHVFGP